MREAVDAVLAQRTRLVGADSKASIGGALLVHLLVAAAFFVAPLLAAQGTEEAPEFVPVYIVPAAALGVPDPQPAPSRPRPAAPEPEPEEETPPPPEPEAEEPEPEPEPVMAAPEPKRRRPPAEPKRSSSRPAGGELARREGSPTGSSTGTSPFGTDTSLSFADQNFTYSYYIDQMLAMIHSQWDRPALGAQVEAAVFFRIRRDGKVSDLRIVESSGFNVFDLAGLRAVRQAAPFPRLPVSYPQSSLAVKLILR